MESSDEGSNYSDEMSHRREDTDDDDSVSDEVAADPVGLL